MSDKIRMTHPGLPDTEIWAGPRSRSSREAAGWVAADETPSEQAPADGSAAPAKTVASRGQNTER